MTSRDARGGARNRVAALTAAAIALIVTPMGLGFRLAAAEGVTPRSGTQQPVVIVTTPEPGATTLPEVVDVGTGQEPVTIEDALTPRPDAVAESRITWLRADGLGIPVPNGGTIDLGGGIEVAVTVRPYPPINFDPAGVDFVVTRNGAPIPGATMTISYDMRFMAHGPFPLQAGATDTGAFTSEYHFFMFGPWQIDANVAAPGLDTIQFSISIYVWPTT
jgi:hypothetical protein